jgi:acetylornithine deacetylase/succinyl-diaminopimelate desuccinylase-like protein
MGLKDRLSPGHLGISMRTLLSAALAVSLTLPAAAQRPDQARFRALYKELVETNTSLSAGSCTLAAQRMAAHLKAAGYPDSNLHFFSAKDHPKEGGLVAMLPGSDPHAKAVLLLGHLDVVEAKRADWTRDPFTLIEEKGYFYGRGTVDMKAQVAAWVDILVRYKEEGFKPRRTIKMALTCGEETSTAFNGANYLAAHERDLIDAEFALNEGGGGRLDASGKPLILTIQAAEKFPQNYQLEVTNIGGHSSRPTPNNAIYHLAAGLTKISTYQFPIQSSDITKQYFAKMGPQVGGEMGAAMTAFAKDPGDSKAASVLAADPSYNAVLHTTCVATLLNAGHANNALPQRADANINCRIFPGTTPQQVRDKLQELVADPEIKVTLADKRSEVPKGPQPLTPQIFKPVETLAAKMWPGIPVVPFMSAGATDGAFLTPAGIPTYGVSGMFGDPDGNGAHGLNERLRVNSVYKGRDFLYEVVKIYANQK